MEIRSITVEIWGCWLVVKDLMVSLTCLGVQFCRTGLISEIRVPHVATITAQFPGAGL